MLGVCSLIPERSSHMWSLHDDCVQFKKQHVLELALQRRQQQSHLSDRPQGIVAVQWTAEQQLLV